MEMVEMVEIVAVFYSHSTIIINEYIGISHRIILLF